MAERILIIKPSSLGDVVTALPLVGDLRRARPGVEIDWFLHPGLRGVVEGHEGVSGIVEFDRKKLGAWWWRPTAFAGLVGLIRKLRRRRYDVVIDAQGLLRSAIFTRLTGAPVRVGFADAREGAPVAYTHKVWLPEGGKKMLAVERMRALGKPLGTDVGVPAEFGVPVAALTGEAAQVAALGGYVVMIPGARWDTKRWPVERFAEVARRLVGQGEGLVLMGSAGEKGLCDQIEEAVGAGSRVVNLAGETGVREMVAVIARARLVIGNDSGPLHVATALGVRVVGLYGPTDPAFVGPYGQMENVIRHEVPCFPCRNKTCGHHSCMQGVTVELVWEKARGMLPAGTGGGEKGR
ncbi:MAG TPA: lipopolysaccharide heptosyltransferase II [Phycisphaerae bacterium]|nr:lipopolysaccharide heptosyltransferase II [Phycisphaerae bacterium]